MTKSDKGSILYREAPFEAQILVYSAIAIFLFFLVSILISMDDIVDGWFEPRKEVNTEIENNI